MSTDKTEQALPPLHGDGYWEERMKTIQAECGAPDTPEVWHALWRVSDELERWSISYAREAQRTAAPPGQPQSEQEANEARALERSQALGAKIKEGIAELRALAAQPPEQAAQQEAQEEVTGRFSSADRLIGALHADRVYIVPTGEVHEGRETFTRHDSPPPLADFETLYASPPQAVEPMRALIEQINRLPRATANEFNSDESDGTPRSFRRPFVSLRKVVELIRAYEAARGIGKLGQGNV